LRRIGTKGRPFYRVVVAKSTAARNGNFVETIGSYDPIAKPKKLEVNSERALHWLRVGAQPTETTAYLLNKTGVLEQYFQERPSARKNYAFLDKRTAATSVASVVDHPTKDKKSEASVAAEPAKEAVAEPVAVVAEPVVEAVAEPEVETVAEPEATPEAEAVAEPATTEPEVAAEPEAEAPPTE
jgi:small subunit ribosomal protein S16